MIPELLSYIVRREGRKFGKLQSEVDLDRIVPGGNGTGVSLYVHIPFCRSLCPFCCFNRYLFDETLARRYFDNLKKEIAAYKLRGFSFPAIYFGGGTPTILMDELSGLIEYLRAEFPVKEISLETTPREITPENVDRLQQLGIRRLSVGVQSFDDAVLKTMGRNNGPVEQVKERLRLAQGKFETLNVDFVFNFPGQSVEQFAADVAAFKEMGLDQATFYPLMASPHKKDAMERKFNRVDNSREQQFYDIIMQELFHGGYAPSTAWCFSRGDHMIDEYIVDYDDYIGVGAGSVSILDGNFLVNTFSLEKYRQFAEEDRLPLIGFRSLTNSENFKYYLLTKLFGGKLDAAAFEERFGDNIYRKLFLELAFLKTAGIVRGDSVLKVTENGMYPVSVMMRDFFAALNTLREYCIENQV